jgi:hypothetical protein
MQFLKKVRQTIPDLPDIPLLVLLGTLVLYQIGGALIEVYCHYGTPADGSSIGEFVWCVTMSIYALIMHFQRQ